MQAKSFLLQISLSCFFGIDFFLAISYFNGLFGATDQWVGVLGLRFQGSTLTTASRIVVLTASSSPLLFLQSLFPPLKSSV